jgi:hypothetical protein
MARRRRWRSRSWGRSRGVDWSDSLDKLPGLLDIQHGEALEVAAGDMGVAPAVAAKTLRDLYRYDAGQVTNLALIHLALQMEHADTVRAGVQAEEDSSFQVPPSPTVVAEYVDKVPKWVDKPRFEALDKVRELRGKDEDVAAWLWAQYGDAPGVLNNLALEYLAQGTDRVAEAALKLRLEHPVEDIPEKLGISRTKSFQALSIAWGADDVQVEQALEKVVVPSDSERARLYVYLAEVPHRLYYAVAKIDWRENVPLLKRLVEDDPNAQARAEATVDKVGVGDRVTNFFLSMVSGPDERGLYERLADNQWAVQQTLLAKDWAATPQQAAEVLRLNPFEARALVAAEVANSPQVATQRLWDTYDPQYRVWLPFAAIGVAATIALAIFGQMAKRWKDMNA